MGQAKEELFLLFFGESITVVDQGGRASTRRGIEKRVTTAESQPSPVGIDPLYWGFSTSAIGLA